MKTLVSSAEIEFHEGATARILATPSGRGKAVRNETTIAKSAAPANSAQSSVRVIDRTMTILRTLGGHGDFITLTELSQKVDLHKSTVLRFLKTLEQGGFAASGPNGKGWRPGSAFLDIQSRVIAEQDLAQLALPLMEETAKQVDETVQLAILADSAIVYLAKVEPLDAPLKLNSQVGTRRPIHCTGLGKVLAAYRDPAEVDAILDKAGMPGFTAATITKRRQLHRVLAQARRDGYATDLGEYNAVVRCVAAPIRGGDGRIVAALSISTFAGSANEARFDTLIATACATATRISRLLGWNASGAKKG